MKNRTATNFQYKQFSRSKWRCISTTSFYLKCALWKLFSGGKILKPNRMTVFRHNAFLLDEWKIIWRTLHLVYVFASMIVCVWLCGAASNRIFRSDRSDSCIRHGSILPLHLKQFWQQQLLTQRFCQKFSKNNILSMSQGAKNMKKKK